MSDNTTSSSILQRIAHLQAQLCDGLVLLILALLLGYPLLSAFIQDTFENLPIGSLFGPTLDLMLSRLDSGAQLGQGPYVIRGLEILVIALPGLFPRPYRPLPKLVLWPLLIFHLLSFLSALLSDQMYSGLTQAFDSLLVTLVALRVRELIPSSQIRKWQLVFLVVQAMLIPACWRQYTQHPVTGAQLNGPFHHSNMVGTYSLLGLAVGLAAVLYQFRQQELPAPEKSRTIWVPGLSAISERLNSDSPLVFAQKVQITIAIAGLVALVSALTTNIILSGSRAALLQLLYLSSIFYCLLQTSRFEAAALARAIGLGLLTGSIYLISWFLLERYAGHSFQILGGITFLAALALTKRFPFRGIILLAIILTTTGMTYCLQTYRIEGNSTGDRLHKIVQSDSSVGARVCFYRAAIRMTAEHPLLGVGPGGFHRFYPQQQFDVRYFSKYVHCVPLAVLCENGVPALLAISLGLIGTLIYAWQQLFIESAQQEWSRIALWRLSSLATLSLLLGCSLFDVQWQFPYFQFIAAFQFGIALSMAESEEVSEISESESENFRWRFRPWVVLNQAGSALLICLFAVNVWSASSSSYQELAQRAASLGKYEEANTLYLYALSLSPLDSELNHKFGLCLLSQWSQLNPERKRLLKHLAQNCVKLDSHRAVHYDLLGKVAEAEKNPQLFHQCALKTLEIDPVNFPSFYNNLAQAQSQLGAQRAALSTVWSAMDRFPDEVLAHIFDFRRDSLSRNLAELNLHAADLSDPVKNPRTSLAYYDKALTFAPEHAQAKFGRAVCLYHLERYQESVVIFEELYAKQPEALYLLAYVVNSYVGLNDGPKAREKEKLYKELEAKQKAAQPGAAPQKKPSR